MSTRKNSLNEVKHTKGPWYISLRDGDHYVWTLENDTNPIAKVNSVYEQSPNANARLIAAAPELLEEVKTLVNILEKGTETPEDLEGAIEWAKMVIDKAEGNEK